jgi:hypothetical protein
MTPKQQAAITRRQVNHMIDVFKICYDPKLKTQAARDRAQKKLLRRFYEQNFRAAHRQVYGKAPSKREVAQRMKEKMAVGK